MLRLRGSLLGWPEKQRENAMISNPIFSDKTRKSWGWDDAQSDLGTGRMARWAPVVGFAHPFDPAYSEGYWLGFRNEPHPTRPDVPRLVLPPT